MLPLHGPRGKGLILLDGPPPRLPLPPSQLTLNAMVQHPMYNMANITRVTAASGQSMVRGDISLGALAGVLKGLFGGSVPLLPLLEARDAYNRTQGCVGVGAADDGRLSRRLLAALGD